MMSKIVRYPDTGRICKRIRVNNKGELHGLQEGWHSNGKRYYTAEYKDGNRHGQSVYFGDDGEKMSIDHFVDDEPHGVSEHFVDGVLDRTYRYKNGEMTQKKEFYADGSGNLKKVTPIRNDKVHGQVVTYKDHYGSSTWAIDGKFVTYEEWHKHEREQRQIERNKEPLVVALRPLTDKKDFYLDHNVDDLVNFMRRNKDQFMAALGEIDADVRCPSCGDDFHIKLTKCKSDSQT
jgi:hypothetical protein